MTRTNLLRSVSLAALTLTCLGAVARADEILPDVIVTARAGQSSAPVNPPAYVEAKGQTKTDIDMKAFDQQPMFSVADFLDYSPGVTVTQGMGPRDMGINIRGSNAANAFGIRNIVLLEDGFPITTADGGNSRTDALDPHDYIGVDVFRGPSSAMFGNYAIGGAIDFNTRTGAQIDGGEIGMEAGSFGYLNNYLIAGKKVGAFDVSAFVSNVQGDGYIYHTAYDLRTADLTMRWSPDPSDRLTVKFLQNDTDTQMAVRESVNVFNANPFQQGCLTITAANKSICPAVPVPLPANGLSGPVAAAQSSAQLGLRRDNVRDILAARYEHDFDAATTWRTQLVYDFTENKQPTVPSQQTQGPTQAFNFDSGLVAHAPLFGFATTEYADVFADSAAVKNLSYYDVPNTYGNGALGGLVTDLHAYQTDVGAKARAEMQLTGALTAVAGLSTTETSIQGVNETFTSMNVVKGVQSINVLVTPTLASVKETMWTTTPELSLVYKFNTEWQAHVRYGTAFGTPYYQQLFTTPQGTPGDNTSLKTQYEQGVDVGADWSPANLRLKAGATLFYEWYDNEILAQVATNGQTYYFNVPQTVHRGLEATAQYAFTDELKLTGVYTLDNQYFANFVDTIAPASGASGSNLQMNRAGNALPDVPMNSATARLSYDQKSGPLQGLGAYSELVYVGNYYMDNGNLIQAPAHSVVNLNVHYEKEFKNLSFRKADFFFTVDNVFNTTYIASQAGAITDTVTAGAQSSATVLANSGSIAAGSPRAFIAGAKLTF